MKKTYQNPEIKIVRIETAHIIAASEQIGFGTSVNNASGADARRNGSLWDDDDEY